MPELPDVEVFRQYFDSTSLNKTVTNVNVKNTKILEDVSVKTLEKRLTNRVFTETDRHGKNMFVHVDDKFWLLFHFGMTGELKYFRDMDEDPQHDRLLFTFDNGYHLAYDCQRMIGHVRLIDDKDKYIQQKELGPDALEVNLSTFKDIIGSKRGGIKSALMDQNTIAGIGNEYSDEILFQVGLHPKKKVTDLGDDSLKEIYNAMIEVLHTAIDAQVDLSQFPDSYLLPHREKGGTCPLNGGKIQQIKVIGRTAYYCPDHQQK